LKLPLKYLNTLRINRHFLRKHIYQNAFGGVNLTRVRDFFFAGTVAGFIGGIYVHLYAFTLVMASVNFEPPWVVMAEFITNPHLAYTRFGQLLGWITSFSSSIANGIAVALTIKFTGKDYIYLKAILVPEAIFLITLTIIYPALGVNLVKNSINTNYISVLDLIPYGLIVGYLLNRFAVFNTTRNK
jgi:hypothetical protein